MSTNEHPPPKIASRNVGYLPNGKLILSDVFNKKKSYSQVVSECTSMVDNDPVFKSKHPEIKKHPDDEFIFTTTQLSHLIREVHADNTGEKLKILAYYFGYDNWCDLTLNKSCIYKLEGDEHNAKIILLKWAHRNIMPQGDDGKPLCALQHVLDSSSAGTLGDIHPDLPKLDLGPLAFRTVFQALEKSGAYALKSGRYKVIKNPVSVMIQNVKSRRWVLNHCIAEAYDEEFGNKSRRKALSRLLTDPIKALSKAYLIEDILEADADCQVALAAGNSSNYRHVLIELPAHHAAMTYIYTKRQDNPDGQYPEGCQYRSFEDWHSATIKVNLKKWNLIYESLRRGTDPQEDIEALIEEMTEAMCCNLKAIEYAKARPLGKAIENTRYCKLKPLEDI